MDEVLQSSGKGSLIIDYYRKNNILNDGIRTTLVDLIISYMITKQIPMSISLAKSMAEQIVAMFKTEIEVFILFHITTIFFIINYFGILYRTHIL